MDLSSSAWWRDLGERVVRNVVQTMGPVIGAMLMSGAKVDAVSVAWATGAVILFTVLKTMIGLKAGPDAAWYVVWADRLGSAAAAALLALLPADLLQVNDWRGLLLAAGGSVISSLVMLYATPPTQHDLVLAA